MEIEAKLIARDREPLERLASRRRLGRWRLEPRRTERLESLYLDTSRGDLRRARIGCRIRRHGRSLEATVKMRGSTREGIHRRPEWTVPLARIPRFPWRLPPTLARHLPPGLRRVRLEPILRTSIRRRIRLVRGGPDAPIAAELALDEVVFRVPGRSGAHRELEVEIERKDGDTRDLEAITRAIRRLGGLRPTSLSKLERGLKWARRKTETGSPAEDENGF